MNVAITFKNVSLFYNERLILNNFSFAGISGTLTLVLGANGAGKSSLLRLMAGLEKPEKGSIDYRTDLRIAYLGHPTFIYPELTARQNLNFWAKIHRISESGKRIAAALERMGLTAFADCRAGEFSRGMAQRLNFCRCLLATPDLVLLDEPFTGLDQASQTLMGEEIRALRANGACIYLVSHAPDADAPLADKIFTITGRSLHRQEPSAC